MNVKKRIKMFNEQNRPFYIVDHEDGMFSLCLPLAFLPDEYRDFGQAAFDTYAISVGKPPVDSFGFKTHGNGYEWQAAFMEAFDGDPNLEKIMFDSEAGGFFCDTSELSLLEDFGSRFREICEDTERFCKIVADGIRNRREQQEQEWLMQ